MRKLTETEVLERECLAFMSKHLFVQKKQLDTVAIAAKRVESIETYGANYDKEAIALKVIFDLLKQDGRLMCHKSFEKALADFSVYKAGTPHLALGLQLKTTGVFWKQSQTGNEYFSFRETDGYAGLLMIFVAVHTDPPRVWLANGADITSKGIQIAVRPKRDMKSDRLQEILLEDVGDKIFDTHQLACNGSPHFTLRHYSEHEQPHDKNALAEYNAFKHLQSRLPVIFVDPPVEHMAYDYFVNDKKWQLKLARYCKKRDRYYVNCVKNGGRILSKQTKVQYAIGDFAFLCIQLPQDTYDCCYIVPEEVLQEHGLVGDHSKSDGWVSVYPHRQLTSTKNVHVEGRKSCYLYHSENLRIPQETFYIFISFGFKILVSKVYKQSCQSRYHKANMP